LPKDRAHTEPSRASVNHSRAVIVQCDQLSLQYMQTRVYCKPHTDTPGLILVSMWM